ncbi:Cro/CI family transcriptional regulator [Acidithiobacillus sp.]|jgi:DNA-binding transcriptional regulator YdaS (Cro superfamily)|uniref:Cro/CI family transcriptional regulator n=1 Tax=Acidithiobacillus sp. TaxID=1872118 RepID=UPI003562CF0F
MSLLNLVSMEKKEALRVFSTASALARAVGVTRSAVSQWPEKLTARVGDRVIAAALRSGINPEIFGPLPSTQGDTSSQAPGAGRESA